MHGGASTRAGARHTRARRGKVSACIHSWLIYETAKLVCMNARKMNVAIGQDLLGYQMIELGKLPEDCLHTKIKVRRRNAARECPFRWHNLAQELGRQLILVLDGERELLDRLRPHAHTPHSVMFTSLTPFWPSDFRTMAVVVVPGWSLSPIGEYG